MIVIVSYVLTFGFLAWSIISWITYDSGYKSKHGNPHLNEDRTRTNFNLIALTLNVYECITSVDWKDKLIPKTGIDKEIAEEEKEIAELERHKEKMEKLKNLKRRKEELFEQVEEYSE